MNRLTLTRSIWMFICGLVVLSACEDPIKEPLPPDMAASADRGPTEETIQLDQDPADEMIPIDQDPADEMILIDQNLADEMMNACMSSADCEGGLCRDETCTPCVDDVECVSDPQFGEGFSCDNGQCSCPTGTLGCPCDTGACLMGLSCDDAEQRCISDRCAQGESGTLELCPCDAEGQCESPLECLSENGAPPQCVNRVGREGGLCDVGRRCDSFEVTGGRTLTCQDGVCLCLAGDAGCDCDEFGHCNDMLSCQLNEGRRGTCQPCAGAQGCLCDVANRCDDGLSCQGRLCLPTDCDPGQDGCVCEADSTCTSPATCIPLNDSEVCVICAGQHNCVCGVGNQCDEGLTCEEGVCVTLCPVGMTGCPCTDDSTCTLSTDFCYAESEGAESLCISDLIGTEGFPCAEGATCVDDLECRLNGLCGAPCQAGELECPCDVNTVGECGRTARCVSENGDSICLSCEGGIGCGCANDLDCAEGQCIAEVCESSCPSGSADCPCRVGSVCDEGLSCEIGRCLDPRCPERGVEGCPCDAGRCNDGLTCTRTTDAVLCAACADTPPFELGCLCNRDDQCSSGRCFAGQCAVTCEPGLLGCICDVGSCLFPLSCDDTQTCVDRRGELGAPCRSGACNSDDALCMPNGFCCEVGTVDCGCLSGQCEAGLDCRLGVEDPEGGLCVSCMGEAGCPCDADGACAQDLTCETNVCATSCEGREGEDGCPCLDTSVCTDPEQCDLGERCVLTSRCELNNLDEERCVNCVGDEGCFCLPRQACNDDLSCNDEGRCVFAPPCEAIGQEDCVCTEDGSCDGDLACRLERGFERCVNCIGQEGCLCDFGQSCEDSTCNEQGICECLLGDEGCPCGEGGDCALGLNCIDRGAGLSCINCIGDEGCTCDVGATCNRENLSCSGGVCVDRCELERGLDCDCSSDLTCSEGLNLNCRPQEDGRLACELCLGDEGCYCQAGERCDEGLVCDGGRCSDPCLVPGSEGCQCQDESECNPPTNCRQEGDYQACRVCPGEEECYCDVGATCAEQNLECYQGRCIPYCEPGSEDCRCLDDELCELDTRCIDNVCTSCLGEIGCGCDIGGGCEGDGVCVDGVCGPNSCINAYSCIRAGLEGFLCIDGACRICETNRECERSSAYGLGSFCVLGRCVDPPSECDPELEFCECASAEDCNLESTTAGMVCADFRCVPCRNDDNCSGTSYYGLGAQCEVGLCQAWDPPCSEDDLEACTCQGWIDCQDDEQTRNMLCVEELCRPCLDNTMCEQLSRYGEGSVCEEGRCLPPRRCDPELEVCGCVTALDCDLVPETAGRLCIEGECISCTDDFQCVRTATYGPNSTCNVNSGRCRVESCESNETCCRTSIDCDGLVGHQGELCIDGICTPCVSDTLCARSPHYGDQSTCVTGQCQ